MAEATHAGQLTESGNGKLGPRELSWWIFVIFNFSEIEALVCYLVLSFYIFKLVD